MSANLIQMLNEAAAFIKSQILDLNPEVGIVLGSGLGDLAQEIQDPVFIDYKNIPHFPVSTVAGHAGRFVAGTLSGKRVLCMQGRFHFYEGYSMDRLVFPIQVMKVLGIKSLILTNASGCVRKDWCAGDLMLITDHIKLCPESPLRGANEPQLGERFFDMSQTYTPELQQIAREEAQKLGVTLREGVYQFFSGPNYETPAEVRMARFCGADAVGMSTVPEAIAATHCGLKVLGFSAMTNMAAGVSGEALNHKEVLDMSIRIKDNFQSLVKACLVRL